MKMTEEKFWDVLTTAVENGCHNDPEEGLLMDAYREKCNLTEAQAFQLNQYMEMHADMAEEIGELESKLMDSGSQLFSMHNQRDEAVAYAKALEKILEGVNVEFITGVKRPEWMK